MKLISEKMNTQQICMALLLGSTVGLSAQERIVPIKYGDMEHWTVRYIKESRMLGGETKTLYVLGPTDTIRKNAPYDFSKTIWGISNAYASPAGIDKASCTTQPERRGNGTCARLDTRVEAVSVFGFIDLEVCVAGTLFLGKNVEPVTDTSDPYAAIDIGIPFTQKPKAVMLDLKTRVSPECKVLKANGLSKKKWLEGHDEPEICVYLQKRWEDSNGNIYAKRIATARERFAHSMPDWHNNYRIDIHYGNITQEPYFKSYMDLFPVAAQFKARNSKGKMVPIKEVGWGTADDTPTHVILMITAGCYSAFCGHPGNALWVDNVKWIF